MGGDAKPEFLVGGRGCPSLGYLYESFKYNCYICYLIIDYVWWGDWVGGRVFRCFELEKFFRASPPPDDFTSPTAFLRFEKVVAHVFGPINFRKIFRNNF